MIPPNLSKTARDGHDGASPGGILRGFGPRVGDGEAKAAGYPVRPWQFRLRIGRFGVRAEWTGEPGRAPLWGTAHGQPGPRWCATWGQ